jgi:hypothetical protein
MKLRDGTASLGRGLLTCVESFTSGVSDRQGGNRTRETSTECCLLGNKLGSSLED